MQKRVLQRMFYLSFQAIDALQTAARAKPVASMYMLLGKTQIKAKRFKDAIASFELALSLYVSIS